MTDYQIALDAMRKVADPKELIHLARTAQSYAQQRARRSFNFGQKVKFFARGQWIEGAIENINPKTITVQTPGGKWRVSPSNLQAA